MVVNFDGVWETRIFYNSGTSATNQLPHVCKFDVNVDGTPDAGTHPASIDLLLPTLATVDFETYVGTTFVDLMRACFDTFTDFIRAELWKIPEGTFDATFITALELGVIGTLGATNQLSQQTTFTFRSLGGGTGRIQLMESGFGGSAKQSPPYASAQANALTNHVISDTCPILARDNTRFIARIHQSDGQNEILWRKRNRP